MSRKAKPARYEIAWTDRATGQSIVIIVDHTRNYLSKGTDHIEIHVIRPKTAALPITETGYRSHFIDALELVNAGGPVTFVNAWLDREARTAAWNKRQTARQQGDLFQWADAKREVGKRKLVSKPKRQPAKPRQRGTPRIDNA